MPNIMDGAILTELRAYDQRVYPQALLKDADLNQLIMAATRRALAAKSSRNIPASIIDDASIIKEKRINDFCSLHLS